MALHYHTKESYNDVHTMTKFILVGGYPRKAPDGGKAFAEELVKGFAEPVRVLECLFARPRESWEKAYAEDVEFFKGHLAGRKIEFQMALPEKFLEQVRWANAISIRGGTSEAQLIALAAQSGDWTKELDGKTLAGSSAGADAISKYYYNIDTLKLSDGLGLLPVKFIPHWRSDYNAPNVDWNKALAELEGYKEKLPILTLQEGEFEVTVK
jgi:hypothetical protein